MNTFRRILLKISGESLTENGYKGILAGPMKKIIDQIGAAIQAGYQVAVVGGGGNLYRGSRLIQDLKLDPRDTLACSRAHWVGILMTYANGSMLKTKLEERGIEARHMLAEPFGRMGEPFISERADRHLKKGRVIILSGGTGEVGVTTDSGAIQRAYDIGADIVLKGTKVDGVYADDPVFAHEFGLPLPNRYPRLTYEQFLEHQPALKIMDKTAIARAGEHHIPIRVFNIFEPGSLVRTLRGEGTYSEIGPSQERLRGPRCVGIGKDGPEIDCVEGCSPVTGRVIWTGSGPVAVFEEGPGPDPDPTKPITDIGPVKE